ncbi:MAG TPA: NAD(P)-dependent alcohol dehydrogenase [Kofleriaceae bacterium]|nr:NAD(P)-dependent alcohol dehydrogenase [Kofleriaceae bacterium]
MTHSMRRWEISAVGREGLHLADVAVPGPGPRELLVRTSAVSLNSRDKLLLDSGGHAQFAQPFTPGSDMAGVVEAVGAGASRFAVGDRILTSFTAGWVDGPPSPRGSKMPHQLGGDLPGVLAELVVLPEDWVVAAPGSLDDAQASTLPVAGLTAWTALVELGRLQPGQTVLVQGTGGVSLFALQIASAAGARVIVISGSDEKLERARGLGAAHGINRLSAPSWPQAVKELTAGRGADHVLEMVGGENLDRSLDALAPGGRVSVIGVLEAFDYRFGALALFRNQATVQGIFVGPRRALEDFVRAVDQLRLEPVIDAEYDFADLPRALDHLGRGPFGKVVLRV